MSSSNDRNSPPPAEMSRRRGSVTQATLSTLFQRSNTATGSSGTAAFPSPITTGMGDQRRRLSLSAGAGVGLGLSGTSPTNTFLRRASLSTNSSETIDESAVEEDDITARSPFQRRMSFGAGASAASRGHRGMPPSPITNDQGFNWSDQLRSRAESLTMAARPIWAPSSSPPRSVAPATHEKAKTVAEMPPPPAQASSIRPPRESRKPDAFQERILKGDFYMD